MGNEGFDFSDTRFVYCIAIYLNIMFIYQSQCGNC
jgi:hypothetical protein